VIQIAARVGRVRFALVNSGLGVLAAAVELRRLRPDADLVLAIDPDGMPWGPRSPDDIAKRSLICAQAAARYQPDALVFACNTASVHALSALRAEFEPDIPVVGTVPAIKPAAAAGDPVAIWATAATTGSPYQRDLIAQFATGVPVTEVACPGLADAIDAADEGGIGASIAAASAQTPPDIRAIVLGCTEYELIADRIRALRPEIRLHGSARAVAAQALRRAPATDLPATELPATDEASTAALHVLLSGRPGELPPAALLYPEGRFLARRASARPVRRPSPAAPPLPADRPRLRSGSS
jgi:glutamate racemase